LAAAFLPRFSNCEIQMYKSVFVYEKKIFQQRYDYNMTFLLLIFAFLNCFETG
jgi:hypothetical protein